MKIREPTIHKAKDGDTTIEGGQNGGQRVTAEERMICS